MNFNKNYSLEFQNWLDLHWDGITWEGRYGQEFVEFWEVFFEKDADLQEIIDRFDYVLLKVQTGPLHAWFSWLREKFLCYCFVTYDVSIYEIATLSKLNESYIAYLYRDFFIELFPNRDELFDELFQVGNVISKNLYIKFVDICSDLKIKSVDVGTVEVDVMRGLEVTLYPEWEKLLKIIKKEFTFKKFNFAILKEKATLYRQLRFLREVVVLFAIGIIVILGLRYFNQVYEAKLAEKIRIFEPVFKWLEKDKTYKTVSVDKKQIEQEILDVIQFEKKADWVEDFRPEERSGTETEVTLTSADDLPKDFEYVSIEKSDYEEDRKGGFRDLSYGGRKVYRVLMRSVDTSEIRGTLQSILSKYEVTQADNVRPGIEIPGGVYYNIFVPTQNLKNFLGSLSDVGGTTIYESQNRGRTAPGTNKVFIWVKQI